MIDLIIISLYLTITLLVGIYKGRGIRNVREYAIADRNYTTPVLVATIFGTLIGGGSTIGITESIFGTGIIFLFVFLGDPIHKMVISELIAPRIGRFHNMISVGDIMESFYGKAGKLTSGFCGFILLAGLLGAQIGAFGYIFHYFTGMSPAIAIVLAAAVVVIYSAFGGIRAVTATDVVQFGVILIAIPIIANVALMEVGGITELFKSVPADKISFFPPGESKAKYIVLMVLFWIPFLNPAVTQRLLMARDVKQIKTSLRIAALLDVPFYVIMAIIALCVLVLEPSIDAKLALPFLVDEYLPVGIKGFAIAGMLSVIMSTADSYLNAASVCFVHDFIKPLANNSLSNKAELILTRLCTVVVGCLAVFSALYFKSIVDIILQFIVVWGPIVVVPLYAGIFGYKSSPSAFKAGAAAGFLAVILWTIFVPDIEPLIPSMIANAIFFFVVSKYTNKHGVEKLA